MRAQNLKEIYRYMHVWPPQWIIKECYFMVPGFAPLGATAGTKQNLALDQTPSPG